MMLEMIAES